MQLKNSYFTMCFCIVFDILLIFHHGGGENYGFKTIHHDSNQDIFNYLFEVLNCIVHMDFEICDVIL